MVPSAKLAAMADDLASLGGYVDADEEQLDRELIHLEDGVRKAVTKLMAGAGPSEVAQAAVWVSKLTASAKDSFSSMREKHRDLELLADEMDTEEQTCRVGRRLAWHKAEYERLQRELSAAGQQARKQAAEAVRNERMLLLSGAKPSAAEGKLETEAEQVQAAEDITASLRRTRQKMAEELEHTSATLEMMKESDATLLKTSDEYQSQRGIFATSRRLLRKMQVHDLLDRVILWGGLAVFMLVAAYVISKRIGYFTPSFLNPLTYVSSLGSSPGRPVGVAAPSPPPPHLDPIPPPAGLRLSDLPIADRPSQRGEQEEVPGQEPLARAIPGQDPDSRRKASQEAAAKRQEARRLEAEQKLLDARQKAQEKAEALRAEQEAQRLAAAEAEEHREREAKEEAEAKQKAAEEAEAEAAGQQEENERRSMAEKMAMAEAEARRIQMEKQMRAAAEAEAEMQKEAAAQQAEAEAEAKRLQHEAEETAAAETEAKQRAAAAAEAKKLQEEDEQKAEAEAKATRQQEEAAATAEALREKQEAERKAAAEAKAQRLKEEAIAEALSLKAKAEKKAEADAEAKRLKLEADRQAAAEARARRVKEEADRKTAASLQLADEASQDGPKAQQLRKDVDTRAQAPSEVKRQKTATTGSGPSVEAHGDELGPSEVRSGTEPDGLSAAGDGRRSPVPEQSAAQAVPIEGSSGERPADNNKSRSARGPSTEEEAQRKLAEAAEAMAWRQAEEAARGQAGDATTRDLEARRAAALARAQRNIEAKDQAAGNQKPLPVPTRANPRAQARRPAKGAEVEEPAPVSDVSVTPETEDGMSGAVKDSIADEVEDGEQGASADGNGAEAASSAIESAHEVSGSNSKAVEASELEEDPEEKERRLEQRAQREAEAQARGSEQMPEESEGEEDDEEEKERRLEERASLQETRARDGEDWERRRSAIARRRAARAAAEADARDAELARETAEASTPYSEEASALSNTQHGSSAGADNREQSEKQTNTGASKMAAFFARTIAERARAEAEAAAKAKAERPGATEETEPDTVEPDETGEGAEAVTVADETYQEEAGEDEWDHDYDRFIEEYLDSYGGQHDEL